MVKVAVDLVNEGAISKDEAILRMEPDKLDELLHPTFDRNAARDVLSPTSIQQSPARFQQSGLIPQRKPRHRLCLRLVHRDQIQPLKEPEIGRLRVRQCRAAGSLSQGQRLRDDTLRQHTFIVV